MSGIAGGGGAHDARYSVVEKDEMSRLAPARQRPWSEEGFFVLNTSDRRVHAVRTTTRGGGSPEMRYSVVHAMDTRVDLISGSPKEEPQDSSEKEACVGMEKQTARIGASRGCLGVVLCCEKRWRPQKSYFCCRQVVGRWTGQCPRPRCRELQQLIVSVAREETLSCEYSKLVVPVLRQEVDRELRGRCGRTVEQEN
jgi:hypothetical protein